MLRALAEGETDAVRMADMAKKQLRKKIPQLQLALEGYVLPHHRWLLREMIEDLDHVGAKITRIEETIEQQMRPFQSAVDRWVTIPGIKHRIAWTLVAEVGPTVEAFSSAADIVSWAGVCPGNNQTGGNERAVPRALAIPGCGERCVRAPGQLLKPRGLICRRSSGA